MLDYREIEYIRPSREKTMRRADFPSMNDSSEMLSRIQLDSSQALYWPCWPWRIICIGSNFVGVPVMWSLASVMTLANTIEESLL